MFSSRRSRIALVVVTIVCLGTVVPMLWKTWRIRSLESLIVVVERKRLDGQLLPAILELSALTELSRDQKVMGINAAMQMRDARAASQLIHMLDMSDSRNAKWLEDLVDINFGPLNSPHAGAATCREVIKRFDDNCEARQKLLFYYAMMLDHRGITELVRDTVRSGCAASETYVYFFLSDALRLQNGVTTCQAWLKKSPADESLRVAMAIHLARSFEGTVPSLDETRARQLRQAQSHSRDMIVDLLMKHPRNQSLLAYAMTSAIERSDVEYVASLFLRAPPDADRDNRFWRCRGWLSARIEDWPAALESLDRALELHPVDWTARFYRAEALRQLERLDEAETEYELSAEGRALQRELIQQPNVQRVDPTILMRLAEYLTRCGLQDLGVGLAKHVDAHE